MTREERTAEFAADWKAANIAYVAKQNTPLGRILDSVQQVLWAEAEWVEGCDELELIREVGRRVQSEVDDIRAQAKERDAEQRERDELKREQRAL